jgi:Polyketide cyclase / dehydrase and lipid transport
MDINRQASLVTRKELFIQAQPHAVWKTHTDINAWSRWQPGIALSKMDDSLHVGSVFQWKSGGLTITATIEVVESNQRIGWIGRAFGTQAKHIWIFQPHKDGTLVTTEESMDGWLVQVLKVVMPTFLDDSLDVWLQSLKQQAEGRLPKGTHE